MAHEAKLSAKAGTLAIGLSICGWACIGFGIWHGTNHDLGTPHWEEAALLCVLLGFVAGVISIRSIAGESGFCDVAFVTTAAGFHWLRLEGMVRGEDAVARRINLNCLVIPTS